MRPKLSVDDLKFGANKQIWFIRLIIFSNVKNQAIFFVLKNKNVDARNSVLQRHPVSSLRAKEDQLLAIVIYVADFS